MTTAEEILSIPITRHEALLREARFAAIASWLMDHPVWETDTSGADEYIVHEAKCVVKGEEIKLGFKYKPGKIEPGRFEKMMRSLNISMAQMCALKHLGMNGLSE